MSAATLELRRRPFAIGERLAGLLENFFDLSSIDFGQAGEVFAAIPGVLAKIPETDTSAEYHELAIDILTPIAPLTSTPIDDKALQMIKAVNASPLWHEFVDDLLTRADALGIPDGAMVLRLTEEPLYPSQSVLDELGGIAADGGTAAMAFTSGLPTWLPILLELIRLFREARRAN